MSIRARTPFGSASNVIIGRMRRRVARVGILVLVLSTLVTALVIFTVCACKSIH